jgi:hypothetical protein
VGVVGRSNDDGIQIRVRGHRHWIGYGCGRWPGQRGTGFGSSHDHIGDDVDLYAFEHGKVCDVLTPHAPCTNNTNTQRHALDARTQRASGEARWFESISLHPKPELP